MKPYSIDLRQKIVDTYLEDKISQRELATRFKVALSFVQKILKQYRETGNIAPKVREEQTPPKLNEQQLKILEEIVEANNDATLAEIRISLEQKTGVLIGRSTVDRMLKKIGITVKKKHCTLRKKKLKEFRS
ncbi:transposase [Calothrix sp. NIES-4101]|nr:transposase [Calothrix sp. NIES-4101]BAZ37173.1 transposase [Calothrix sp. NIES-4101]BAZ39736.1 transposase [Calothrix sp. NIES-4101]BAZ40123.1 transposase [Calothrix sp. NIES-4101]BAZ40489.1 transposase [Calothrix sp. NIES-4101]